ncbi:nuclear transport factor 2 family protein [Actinomadura oligospora]|uniref:nuclear transport factor 2 family protein n=1 Tax=Actinomadura oligospora TaxID=111804 RepID=UPI0004B816D3|nr:nuclear transport factor 2 family protein [Actinomadura oligospora]
MTAPDTTRAPDATRDTIRDSTRTTTPDENLALVRRFYEAYGRYDLDAMRETLAPDISWHIPGRHPLAGTHHGLDELMAFFGELARSAFKAEVLYLGADENYVVDLHRGWSNREDGDDLDQVWVLVYQIRDGRIAEVRDFASDQAAADDFFNRHHRLAPIDRRLAG